MKPLIELREAAVGWFEMLTARPDAARRFNLGRSGLINALLFYALMVVVTLVVQNLYNELPTYTQVFFTLGANVLPLVGFAGAVLATTAMLRPAPAFNTLFVPATYALCFVLAIGLPLSLMAGNLFSNALIGVLGYMLYREGRDIGKMSIGISIAFAALSVVALVALPFGLYMLVVPAAPPA